MCGSASGGCLPSAGLRHAPPPKQSKITTVFPVANFLRQALHQDGLTHAAGSIDKQRMPALVDLRKQSPDVRQLPVSLEMRLVSERDNVRRRPLGMPASVPIWLLSCPWSPLFPRTRVRRLSSLVRVRGSFGAVHPPGCGGPLLVPHERSLRSV